MQTRLAAAAAFALGAALFPPRLALAQDTAGVRAAVLDYVEGFYQGDSTRLVRSVRPEVYKYGFARSRDATTYRGMQMTWPEFHAYANRVKARGTGAPPDAPKQVDIFDVQDQTAAAKLTAWWGTDYLLLARYDGRWMITHVLWQSPPPKEAAKR